MGKVLLAFLFFSLTSCVFTGNRVKGNGEAATEVRRPGSFTGVELHSSFQVALRKGAAHEVEVHADQNLLSYIQTRVAGDELVIETRDGKWLSPRNRIRIIVTSPNITALRVSGSGDIKSNFALQSNNTIDISITGSGTINAPVDAPVTDVSVSGSGDVQLQGQTRDLNASVTGSGDVRCFDLSSEATTVSLTGSGDAEVHASKRLDVSLVGSGDVRYKGKPAITKNKTGSGSINAVD